MGYVDVVSLLMIGLYAVGMRHVFVQEKQLAREEPIPEEPNRYGGVDKRRAYLIFAFYAALIIGSGIGLSFAADAISTFEIDLWGIKGVVGQSLVGIILLAVATSLPELMVSIGALKIGAVDMAIGNVFGSNMFNMLIIGIADLFYPAGSIYNRPTITEPALRTSGLASHLDTGLCGLMMVALVGAAIARRGGLSKRRFGTTSVMLLLVFIACYVILFKVNFG